MTSDKTISNKVFERIISSYWVSKFVTITDDGRNLGINAYSCKEVFTSRAKPNMYFVDACFNRNGVRQVDYMRYDRNIAHFGIRVVRPKNVLKVLARFHNDLPELVKLKHGNYLMFHPGNFFLSHYLLLDFATIISLVCSHYGPLKNDHLIKALKTYRSGRYYSPFIVKAISDFDEFSKFIAREDVNRVFTNINPSGGKNFLRRLFLRAFLGREVITEEKRKLILDFFNA